MGQEQDPIVRQAVEWMVLMRSGEATPEEAKQFQAWRKRDPRHEAACARMENVLGGLSNARADNSAAMQALATRRRAVKALFGIGAVSVLGSAVLLRSDPFNITIAKVFADHKSDIGERRTFTLDDGTTATLNANSVADSDTGRIQLLSGEVFVRHQTGMPLRVSWPSGNIVASGAAFAVRHRNETTRIAVLEGSIHVQVAGRADQRLAAAKVALASTDGLSIANDRTASAELAWLDGVLEVADRPLYEVIDALRDYRKGDLMLDPSIANRRISGIFPLDDTDKALRSIAQTLNVRVRVFSPHQTRVESVST